MNNRACPIRMGIRGWLMQQRTRVRSVGIGHSLRMLLQWIWTQLLRSTGLRLREGDTALKTMSKTATVLLLGLWIIPALNASASTWHYAAHVVNSLTVGQLNLFKPKQPPADPFNKVGGEARTLLSNDSKTKAADFVRRGRDALAQGQVAGAIYFHDRARELGATFAANEDSPTKLAAAIRQQGGRISAVPVRAPQRLPAFTPGRTLQRFH